MLQNPRIAFRDPRLQACTIEKDQRNQPRPWAGAFAVVYKGIDAAGRDPFAVRIFTTESPERRERYEQISAYMQGRRLKCLVEFEYRDRSIRSAGDGKWYPMILMEWVRGETLFKWARARCLEGNARALADVARRWVDTVGELAASSISHGDLQHANVMVTDLGEVKLVDYDCMCVPALVGRRNLEVGVEPYQHPQRNSATLLSPDLDNFSALMIYVALRALAAAPQLWHKYIEQTGYDKMLFRKEDFDNPAGSPLIGELRNSADHEVRDLIEQLLSQTNVPMDRVPPLGHLVDSFAKVEQLLRQQQWQAAVDALNRRGHFRDAPEHLKPLIEQAYQFACRKQAWESFCKVPPETSEGNDRRLEAAWNEGLFAGFEAAERQRVRVAEARRRVTLLDRLSYLAQQSSGSRSLAAERGIVEAAKHVPRGYQYTLQPRIEQARRSVKAVERLEQVLDSPVAEAPIVAAWRAVVEAKCERLVDAAWRPRIEMAERRAPALRPLYAINDETPPDQRDRLLLEAWPKGLLDSCTEAQRWRPAYEEAVARQNTIEQLRAAVADGDDAVAAELIEEPCLADYPLPDDCAAAVKKIGRKSKQPESRPRRRWRLFSSRREEDPAGEQGVSVEEEGPVEEHETVDEQDESPDETAEVSDEQDESDDRPS